MANIIIMPKVGVAMEEGTIIDWFVKEGDTVTRGDIILDIETDKSSMEIESEYSGTILKIFHDKGAVLPVTVPIAVIGEPGEDVGALITGAGSATTGTASPVFDDVNEERFEPVDGKKIINNTPAAAVEEGVANIKTTPAARYFAKQNGIDLSTIVPSGKSREITMKDLTAATTGRKTSPLAGRIAADKGIVLGSIEGSGHAGKVMKADLPAGRSEATATESATDIRVKLTKIQEITGHRMVKSHTEIPDVTHNIKADVTEMLELRARLNEKTEHKFTINDIVLAAIVKALRDNPRLNSVLDGNEVVYKSSVHLGLAVATPKGLLVPVIWNAQTMSLSVLAAASRDLTVRGREGKLLPDELSGSTFSVSNVGMFGINSFTPIINQPEAAILGVCAVEDQVKIIDGNVVNRKVMGLSLTYDHRIVDGAEASIFLKDLRDYLEAPLTILV